MHRTVFGFGLALCFFMLFYIPSWAAVFCVDPGGGGTHTDLQNALTAAQSNSVDDTIKVVKGLYSRNCFSYSSDQGNSLVLEGGYNSGCGCREIDPKSTILQGTGSGSVLYIKDSAGGDFTVDGFTLKHGGGENVYYGGGLHAETWATSGPAAGDITIQNNIIEKNSALTTGGGIFAQSYTGSSSHNAGDIILINNIVTGNIANGNYAGGVYAELYAPNASIGTITLLNNTIHGNKAGQNGGGTYLYIYGNNGGTINVFNNIITGNTADSSGQDIHLTKNTGVAYVYNNNYNGLSGSWTASGSNIDSDPLFVSEGSWDENGTPNDITDDVWTEGNYHLKGNSPCIDAGDNTASGLPASDFEGDDRIIDGNKDGNAVVDMGADEYKGINTMPAIPLLLLN